MKQSTKQGSWLLKPLVLLSVILLSLSGCSSTRPFVKPTAPEKIAVTPDEMKLCDNLELLTSHKDEDFKATVMKWLGDHGICAQRHKDLVKAVTDFNNRKGP